MLPKDIQVFEENKSVRALSINKSECLLNMLIEIGYE